MTGSNLGPLDRVVIVGASLAGLRAAERLRQQGFTGRVVVIGAERHLPYDRPPLSKKLLAGEWDPDRVALRKHADMGSLDVEWRLGAVAEGLDLDRRAVTVAGDEVGFDGLVIATGASPRRLPGLGPGEAPDGVVELRTLGDALDLRTRLADGGARVVVVGAGFIGLEVAATAHELGNEVVVLEAAEAPLVRACGAEVGAAIGLVHADAGVEVRCGVGVTDVVDGRIELADDDPVPFDVAVIGIGVAPNTGWLDGSGLTVDDGVVCDATLRAAEGIYAAGDVARWHNPLFDEVMRVEHWTNAAEQGAHAADNLLATSAGGEAAAYAPVPFFWSDQHGHRVQSLGRASADDEVVIAAGSVEERKFLALYAREGRLRAALALDAPRWVMPFRVPLQEGISLDDARSRAAELAGG